mgnify:CR=1 FL=1
MKTLVKILCLCLFWFSCESPTKSEEETLCNEEIEVELWEECYNIDETTECLPSSDPLDADSQPWDYDFDGICDDKDDDLDGDGSVGATDLAIVLGRWGYCPE